MEDNTRRTHSDDDMVLVSVSPREVMLIRNYLNKGKPLNDPANKECMEVVMRILDDIISNSPAQNLDVEIANWFSDNFGIEIDVDPYGENNVVELGENGLVPIKNCEIPELCQDGELADLVQGGFWNSGTGVLENGFIDVDDLNEVIDGLGYANEIDGMSGIRLKKDGKVARIEVEFT